MRAPSPTNAAATVLAQAARAVLAVVEQGRSADDALMRTAAQPSQRAAIRAVTLGSLRWYLRLEALLTNLLAGRQLSAPLRALLVVALHQLEYSRNPPAASVSCAVDATRLLQQPRAAAMINALLRRFGRERAALLAPLLEQPAMASAHPLWLIEALRQAWPQHWQQIVEANNAHPPMTLRLDLTRTSQPVYQQQLAAHGMSAQALPWLASALLLDQPVAVAHLPGFADGLVSVQDAGAQFAAVLLQVQPGERVLDACAAPGGKTCALLEAVDGAIELTALDLDAARMQRIAENLQRLARSAQLVTADLCGEPQWWDGRHFDRILLDAPCSATGVIRRHPDIKLLRRPDDIATLARSQCHILKRCLNLLKPGGRLVYSTCSVLPAENEQVIEAVLRELPQAQTLPMPAGVPMPPDWQSCHRGMQLLPGSAALTDGFYYACLTVT